MTRVSVSDDVAGLFNQMYSIVKLTSIVKPCGSCAKPTHKNNTAAM